MNQSECKIHSSGTKVWYFNNRLSREDGPAVEWADGSKSWWINGEKLVLETAIDDPELQAKYPKLIESIIVYSVHES